MIGIIPAAGFGKRWGNYPKFLLPCGEREWLLDRTINAMPCECVIVYSKETINEIYGHIKRCGLKDKVIMTEQKEAVGDIFGAIRAGLQIEADYYYFAMPDTYYPPGVFDKMRDPGITLGLHYTDTPERFGVLRNGFVIDKKAGLPGLAWGLLGWDRDVRRLWLDSKLEKGVDAINLAMQVYGFGTIKMEYYYDMTNFEQYKQFLKGFK